MDRRQLAMGAVAACAALVMVGGGIVAHDVSHQPQRHTGGNPATFDQSAHCPSGYRAAVIGQWSRPAPLQPVEVIGCTRDIPATYLPGTGLVP